MQRMTIIVVICVLLATGIVGMLIGQTAGGGDREEEPTPTLQGDGATPSATPGDLPPFFGSVDG